MDTQFIGDIASILNERDIIGRFIEDITLLKLKKRDICFIGSEVRINDGQNLEFIVETRGRPMMKVFEDCQKSGAFEKSLEPSQEELSYCVQNGLVREIDPEQIAREKGDILKLRQKYCELYDHAEAWRISLQKDLPYCITGMIQGPSRRALAFLWKKVFREKWEIYKDQKNRAQNEGRICFNLYSAIEITNKKYIIPTAKLAGLVRQLGEDDWYRTLDMGILTSNWDSFFRTKEYPLSAIYISCKETSQSFEEVARQYITFTQRLREFPHASYDDLSYILPAISRTAKVQGDFGLDASREYKNDLAVALNLKSAAGRGVTGDLTLLCYKVNAWNGEYNHLPHEYWKTRDHRLYQPSKKEKKQGKFEDYVLVFQPCIREDVQSMIIDAIWKCERNDRLPTMVGEAIIDDIAYKVSLIDLRKRDHTYDWYRFTGNYTVKEEWIQESHGVSYRQVEIHRITEKTTSTSPKFQFKLRFERV